MEDNANKAKERKRKDGGEGNERERHWERKGNVKEEDREGHWKKKGNLEETERGPWGKRVYCRIGEEEERKVIMGQRRGRTLNEAGGMERKRQRVTLGKKGDWDRDRKGHWGKKENGKRETEDPGGRGRTGAEERDGDYGIMREWERDNVGHFG